MARPRPAAAECPRPRRAASRRAAGRPLLRERSKLRPPHPLLGKSDGAHGPFQDREAGDAASRAFPRAPKPVRAKASLGHARPRGASARAVLARRPRHHSPTWNGTPSNAASRGGSEQARARGPPHLRGRSLTSGGRDGPAGPVAPTAPPHGDRSIVDADLGGLEVKEGRCRRVDPAVTHADTEARAWGMGGQKKI